MRCPRNHCRKQPLDRQFTAVPLVQELKLSCLGWASYLGDRDMAVLLLRFGAELEQADIVLTLQTFSFRFCKDLIVVGFFRQGGRTPLLWAAAEGKAHVVELLLESGANVEAKTLVRLLVGSVVWGQSLTVC